MDMWGQADHQQLQLAPLTSFGWKLTDGILEIEWDSNENIATIKERVNFLTKGCRCKSGCKTSRCGCRKKGWECSEGCECIHCSNLPSGSANAELESDLDEETDEMMEDIFGLPAQDTDSDQETV